MDLYHAREHLHDLARRSASCARPLPAGSPAGRVVHRGGSIASLAGELRDKNGDVLATATAPVRIIRPHRH